MRAGLMLDAVFGSRNFWPAASPSLAIACASRRPGALGSPFVLPQDLPGRCPWAGPSGPAAMPSGRAGLSGRQSFLWGRRPGGPDYWRCWYSVQPEFKARSMVLANRDVLVNF